MIDNHYRFSIGKDVKRIKPGDTFSAAITWPGDPPKIYIAGFQLQGKPSHIREAMMRIEREEKYIQRKFRLARLRQMKEFGYSSIPERIPCAPNSGEDGGVMRL